MSLSAERWLRWAPLVAVLGLIPTLAGCGSETDGAATRDGAQVAGGSAPADRCGELAGILEGAGSASGTTCRVTFPRENLSVQLLGATLPTSMNLTSWAAFGPAPGDSAVVMGDLALTASELPRVMSGLRAGGLRVTAVHRHMMGETPPMSFMHYLGVGPAGELARGLRSALDRAPTADGTGEVPGSGERRGRLRYRGSQQDGVVAGAKCATIAETLGVDPASAGTGPGYCKVSRPRTDLDVTVEGIPVDASLGIGSWFAFRQTAAGDSAVVAGDMALTQGQVNPAIRALREAGIEVVSLHNHMLHEEPRIMYFHFQERGAPMRLARGLRSGLEAAGLVRAR